MKAVRALAAVGAYNHAHGERGPILARAQRAEIVGNPLGQHRHHAIREIHRIAAEERLAVERGAGADIVGHVRDSDGNDVAARVRRIGVGRGMHGVVVILGVHRVDGDEGERPPVLAAGKADRSCGLGLGLRGF